MKSKLFLLFSVIAVLGVSSLQAQNVSTVNKEMQFFVGTWDQAVDMADLMKKPVVVYLYNNTKSACKKMQKEVFRKADVIEFYEQHFVLLKLSVHTEEGLRFKMRHDIMEYPTMAYFDKTGELISMHHGFKNADEFVVMGEYASQRNASSMSASAISVVYTDYLDLKMQYKNGIRHPDFLRKYAYQLRKFNDPYQHIVEEYLIASGGDISQYNNAKFVFDFADDINTKVFDIFLTNRDYYNGLFGKKEVDGKIKNAVRLCTVTAAANRDQTALRKGISIISSTHLPDKEVFVLKMYATYYEKVKDWGKYAEVMIRELDKYLIQDAEFLNRVAWNFALNVNNKNALSHALDWTNEARKLDDKNFKYKETQAALIYKSGKKSKALKEAEAAKTMALHSGADYKSTLQLIETIMAGRAISADLR